MSEPLPPPPAERSAGSPAPLVRGITGLTWLAVVCTVGEHAAQALNAATALPSDVSGGSLTAVPPWGWALLHLLGGAAALAIGHRLLCRAYPLPGLAARAATNPAAALQVTAHRLAAAAIAGACWGGADAPSVLVAAAFTLLSWLALVAILAGHRLVTRYRDQEELAAGNCAAALASAGLHLAVVLIIVHALQGPFQGWGPSLIGFAGALAWVLALYPLRELVLTRLILGLSPREMDLRVAGGQGVWLGATEGLGYLLTALAVTSAW